jgi:hypothetical protein
VTTKSEDYAGLALHIIKTMEPSMSDDEAAEKAARWGMFWEDTQRTPTTEQLAEITEWIGDGTWASAPEGVT